MLLSGDRAAMSLPARATVLEGLRAIHEVRSARAEPARSAAHPAPDPLLGVDRAALGRPRVSGRLPLVQHPALLAGPDPRAARADRADAGRAARRRLRRSFLAAHGQPCSCFAAALLRLALVPDPAPAQDASTLRARHAALQQAARRQPVRPPDACGLDRRRRPAQGRNLRGDRAAAPRGGGGARGPCALVRHPDASGQRERLHGRRCKRWLPSSRARLAIPSTTRTASSSVSRSLPRAARLPAGRAQLGRRTGRHT